MSSQSFTTTQRETIVTRDGSRCVRCGTGVGNVPSSVHHRKPRGMGGTRDPRSSDLRNGVLLCGTGTTGCHGDIENDRAAAYDDGWLLRSYGDLDRPMLALDGSLVHLYPDGTRLDEGAPGRVGHGSIAQAVELALAQRREALS